MNSRQWMGDDNRDSLAPNPDKPVRLGFPKGPTRKQLKAKADRPRVNTYLDAARKLFDLDRNGREEDGS